jgi:hypothetical protein
MANTGKAGANYQIKEAVSFTQKIIKVVPLEF